MTKGRYWLPLPDGGTQLIFLNHLYPSESDERLCVVESRSLWAPGRRSVFPRSTSIGYCLTACYQGERPSATRRWTFCCRGAASVSLGATLSRSIGYSGFRNLCFIPILLPPRLLNLKSGYSFSSSSLLLPTLHSPYFCLSFSDFLFSTPCPPLLASSHPSTSICQAPTR